jgi:gluconolactonase
MTSQRTTSRSFTDLFGENPALETIGSGFIFTEGPIWDPENNVLYFSDMPGDVRRRWSESDGVTEVKRPSNKCNGMAYDSDGGLLVCEHSTSRLIREERDGSTTVLASHYEGKELNSPNDVIVTLSGDIYFSDPIFGRVPGFGVEREQDLDFQGLYRIPAGTDQLELVAGDFEQPNGMCMSPDESILYVNDTSRAHIRTFSIGPDGRPSASSSVFIEGVGNGVIEDGVVDGMKADSEGNIYVTGPGGVWVIDPSGVHLGTLEVPENVGNLNWGGPDFSTLFLAASTSLYRIQTNAVGAPVPNMRRRNS